MTIEQTNDASPPSFSNAELERLLDEWADAAGHIWMTRGGEQATGGHVRREDLAQLARAATLIEREACAVLVEGWPTYDIESAAEAAKAIRMRSNLEFRGATPTGGASPATKS